MVCFARSEITRNGVQIAVRFISAVSSWHSQLPKATGPVRTDVLAPVASIPPSRRSPRETAEPLNESALSGEYIATKTTAALLPVDFSRHVFDTLVKAVHAESENANAGLAIKAVHAYLFAAMPAHAATGLGIDGYA